MTTLIFKAAALRPIVEHALSCREHVPTFAMQLTPAYWREGVKIAPGGWPKPEDLDLSKVPPHLQLVKDDGVYLMSSGSPRLLDPASPAPGRSLVVYAEGMAPEDGWDAWQILGGDDFVEQVDLAFVKKAIDLGAENIRIKITATRFTLEFDSPKAAPSRMKKRGG